MTFPLDPAARPFQAKAAEQASGPDELVQLLPPECFQAEADEHAGDDTPPAPTAAGTPPSS